MALAAVMTQTLLPRIGGGRRAGGGAADGRIRRAAAHPQECAAAPAPGDHDHAAAAGPSRSRSRSPGWSKDGLVEWREAHARAAHVEEFEQLAPDGRS